MIHLIIHVFHTSLTPLISLYQYLTPNLYSILNMHNMRFFSCEVYLNLSSRQMSEEKYTIKQAIGFHIQLVI